MGENGWAPSACHSNKGSRHLLNAQYTGELHALDRWGKALELLEGSSPVDLHATRCTPAELAYIAHQPFGV